MEDLDGQDVDIARALVGQTCHSGSHVQYCGGVYTATETMPSIWEDVCGVWQDGTFQESMLQQKK